MAVVFKKPSTPNRRAAALLPRLHARHHSPPCCGGDRRARHRRQNGRRGLGRLLRYVLRLFHLRYGAGAARHEPQRSQRASSAPSPEDVVFTYQGDGDLAAIGTAETVHAATRGENITVIFVNNAIYGMTGGQMAPTSLPNQVTQTTPYGRDVNTAGYPVRICEMLSTLDGVALAQRVTVDNVKNVNIAKKAIKKAFQNQIEGKGYSIVEVLSTCPTNWGMSPVEALDWLEKNMIPYYPLGVYKDGTKGDRLK